MIAAGFSLQAAVAPAALAATGGYPFTNAVCQSATDTVAGVQYCEGSDWALNGKIFDPSYGGYAYRNCTDWVAYRLKTNNGYTMPSAIGDASAWGAYFADHGVAVNTTPAVGAIAWLKGGDHVAYVEAVNGNQVTVSEYNEGLDPNKTFNPKQGEYWTNGAYDTRTVASSAFNYIHVKDITQTLPAQPANPKVISTTGTSAVLAWTDASNNDTGFASQYRVTGTSAWTAGPSVGANATSMTVSGLRTGTSYTFQVGARNAKGTHWSAYFPGKTVALPSEPTGVSAKTSATSAVLTWKDNSNNETSFVSQYKITGSSAWTTGPSKGANSTSMTVTGLKPGTHYTFQVGARNVAGTHWSAYATGYTPQVLPAQPASPRVTSATGTSEALAWTDASDNETGFVSQYRVGSGSWIAGPSVGANVTSMTVTGLKNGTDYTFQVGARNSVGTHWSAYFYGWTQALPAEPTGGSASMGSTSAALTWTDNSNNENEFVTQYRPTGSSTWIAGPSVGANVTSVTLGGLNSSTGYTFQVGARNSVGTHWSAYFYGTTAAQPAYNTGRQVSIDSHATGGVSGHTGPGNSYSAGPTHPANSALWIVCYVNGQSITGPYNTTTIWDVGDDGYYYTDAWLYTGTNGPAVPACAMKTVTVDSHATGGVSGHTGPGNSYTAGPTRAVNSAVTLVCYVNGQSITGPYNTTTIWDLATDGYYYTDAWLYTGTNGPAVPVC
jgi:surface antigen